MQLTIHTFAVLQDLLGTGFSLEVEPDSTVGEVLESLSRKGEETARALRSSRVAVQEELVESDYRLQEGDELFLLPPSSGG